MHDDRPESSAMMPSLQPGAILGRYQLLCVVAQGGMGAVWAARLRADHGFERNVAVKTILPQHAQDQRFRQMFLDEARLASRIIHANVVQVLDLAEQDGVLFLAMEWVEGDSLRALAGLIDEQHASIAWPIAVRIVLEVAKGLHAAHELRDDQGAPLQVVHRDVSPQNIMVALDGSVHISDFGIAKARDRLSPETAEGHVKGKLRYMAPEQAMGKPVDRRADIWSLGAILYELLSGRPVHDAPNDAALLYAVVSTPPTLLFEQPIHPRLLALLRRALSRSPEGRHPSTEAFANELRRASKEAGLEATTEDLAKCFQQHLGKRCEARRKIIEQAAASASALAPLAAEGVEYDARQASDEAEPASGELGTLSRFSRSARLRRRRPLIAGAVVLGGIALAIGWTLFAPHETLTANRSPSFRRASFPARPTAVASSAPSASAPVAPTTLPTSGHSPSPSQPTKHAPPPSSRPPFEDIDDGF